MNAHANIMFWNKTRGIRIKIGFESGIQTPTFLLGVAKSEGFRFRNMLVSWVVRCQGWFK